MAKTHKDRPKLVRGSGVFALNQHAPKFADKRTKRSRTRAAQKRKALAEQ